MHSLGVRERFIAFIVCTISCDRQKEILRLPSLFYLRLASGERKLDGLLYIIDLLVAK